MRALALDAESAFIGQCGLAPGFISIVANDMAKRFDVLDTVNLRVGALPEYPTNSLSYNLTWSTEGVINEYCEPCIAIENGLLTEVPPLTKREEFSLDGVDLRIVQHVRGTRNPGRHAGRPSQKPQLPDDSLSGTSEDHEDPFAGSAPVGTTRSSQERP